MRPRKAKPICLAALLMATATPSAAQSVGPVPGYYQPKIAPQVQPMRVEVIDGVRFRDIETRALYRLVGIDVCAPEQTASLGRQPWPCGTMATAWLVGATLNKWLSCAIVRDDGDERLARCATTAHPDLAAAMLREGVAVATPADPNEPAIRAYQIAEQQARKAFRGLWSSTFQMPWEWRAEHRKKARPATVGGAML